MNREYSEDTLKNNLIVPVSYSKLKFAKIAITVFATFLFIAVSFLCSIVFALVLQYPFNLADIGMAFWKLLVTGISCLIAVMPIIAFFFEKNLFGRNLRGICLWILWYFCGKYTFYKLVSNHNWVKYHKIRTQFRKLPDISINICTCNLSVYFFVYYICYTEET